MVGLPRSFCVAVRQQSVARDPTTVIMAICCDGFSSLEFVFFDFSRFYDFVMVKGA